MKNVSLLWLAKLAICHFLMCVVAAFVAWDINYFWMSNWSSSGRGAYFIMMTIANIYILSRSDK